MSQVAQGFFCVLKADQLLYWQKRTSIEYACAIRSSIVGSIVKIELRECLKFGPLWTDTN